MLKLLMVIEVGHVVSLAVQTSVVLLFQQNSVRGNLITILFF